MQSAKCRLFIARTCITGIPSQTWWSRSKTFIAYSGRQRSNSSTIRMIWNFSESFWIIDLIWNKAFSKGNIWLKSDLESLTSIIAFPDSLIESIISFGFILYFFSIIELATFVKVEIEDEIILLFASFSFFILVLLIWILNHETEHVLTSTNKIKYNYFLIGCSK